MVGERPARGDPATSTVWWSRAAVALLAWHALGTALALWIGVAERDPRLAFALLSWSVLALAAFRAAPGPYLLAGGLLALVE